MNNFSISLLAVVLLVSTTHALPAEPTELIISAVGDIMLDGTARPVLAEQGYDYPFVQMLRFDCDCDLVGRDIDNVRIMNGHDEVMQNIEGVLAVISQHLQTVAPSPQPSPTRGEGV